MHQKKQSRKGFPTYPTTPDDVPTMDGDFIKRTEHKIDTALEWLKSEIALQFSKREVSIVISEDNFIPNTFVLRSIEFEVNGIDSDDNGMCVSFSLQRYDPSNEKYQISDDSIFFSTHLSTSNGWFIENLGVREILINNAPELEAALEESVTFIKRQKEVIIKKIKTEYLS